MTRIMRLALVLLALPAAASAGEGFTALDVHPGDYVFVTDAEGVEVSGLLREASTRSVTIGDYTLTPRDTLRIERRGDSVWDGAAKGFALGAIMALPVARYADDGDIVLGVGAVYGLAGAVIDLVHTGRTRVYGPRESSRARGLARARGPLLWTRDSDASGRDFARLPAAPGDIIYVAGSSGAIVGGRLTDVSPSRLAIGRFEFRPEPGLTIYRHGDPLWDGAARGFVVGAVLSATVLRASCLERSRLDFDCTIRRGARLAVMGAMIDRSHIGRTRIFRIGGSEPAMAVRVAPFVSDRGAGLGVSWRF